MIPSGPVSMRVLSMVVATAVCGCSISAHQIHSEDELREIAARRLAGMAVPTVVVPHAVDERSLARARRLVGEKRGRAARLRALVAALYDPRGFGLKYRWASGGTARETLERGHGNCLSLASVVVGMARGIGLPAYYADVTGAPPSRHREGELWITAGHIAALVRTDEGDMLVDFAAQQGRRVRYRRLSDLQALAHYYNNRAYEMLHAANRAGVAVPWRDVARDFEVAARIAPTFAEAWNNLGVARVRLGDAIGARDAYGAAAAARREFLAPKINLAMLHISEGSIDAARELIHAVARRSPNYPSLAAAERALEEAGAPIDRRFTGPPKRSRGDVASPPR